jgi:hypothetical protein
MIKKITKKNKDQSFYKNQIIRDEIEKQISNNQKIENQI